jgi:anion-transporting  ArsA/GET3 family ATPase
MSGLLDQLGESRVVICTGGGGVGKTTVAAAVALGLAAAGDRVALVTIDPARRLAEALGLADLGNDPRPVDLAPFEQAGLTVPGELEAMMLNVKRTFDELVVRLAPDRTTVDQILANPVYDQISTAVAGSQEYTAMAKLFELHRLGTYDVIVLDTPPSRSAVDFLRAPQRLNSFLGGRALNMLIRPTGMAMRMTGLAFAVLRRIMGVGMLDDVTRFFRLMGGLIDGFRERATDVEALLINPSTAFVIVSSPEPRPVEEAIYLEAELAELGLRPTALVVNRRHPRDPDGSPTERVAERLSPALGEALARRVATVHGQLQLMAEHEQESIDRLTAALGRSVMFGVPDRGADLHDAAGLVWLCRELFSDAPLESRL